MILAIDTSTALTSVAAVDGATGAAVERAHLDPQRHAEVLAPMLVDVLAEVPRERIRVVACGVGPGPYTGLRVGIATARALGAAWRLPVVGLCSLDAIAFAARANGPIAVAGDARRREVYWATYDADGMRVTGPLVTSAEVARAAARDLRWVGAGARAHGDVLGAGDEAFDYPRATWIAQRVGTLGATLPAAKAFELAEHGGDGTATAAALAGAALLPPQPLYLRRPDARVPA